MKNVPKTIEFHSDEKIEELFKKLGAINTLYNCAENDKINSKGINIQFKTKNKIDEIFKQFFQRKIFLKMEDIKLSKGEIIAKDF